MLTPNASLEILTRYGLREKFGHLWGSALLEMLCATIRARDMEIEMLEKDRDKTPSDATLVSSGVVAED